MSGRCNANKDITVREDETTVVEIVKENQRMTFQDAA
jgi:hypothetical protein